MTSHRTALRPTRVPLLQVFFLKGASSNLQPHVVQRLRIAVAQAKHTIILTDPDKAGQLARTQLQQLLPQASHAFIPASQATSATSSWCAASDSLCLHSPS